MSISSDEINLLVQHYLQELGYTHAAFTFGCESNLPKKFAKNHVQPGALVYLIQKGIMFANMETAAENALTEPEKLFAKQLNLLRENLYLNSELIDEISKTTSKMKVFPTSDEIEISPIFLNHQSSLILQAHKTPSLVCAWNSTSEYMATGSEGGSVVMWRYDHSTTSYQCVIHHVATFTVPKTDDNTVIIPQDITALEWSSDEEAPILVAGTFSGDVKLFNQEKQILTMNCHQSPVVAIKFSSDGQNLLTVGSKGTIALISNNEITSKWSLECDISDCCWIDNERIYVVASKNVYQIVIGQNPVQIYTANEVISQIIPDPERESFAIVDNSGYLTIIDSNGTAKSSSLIHNGCICCSCWTKNSKGESIIVTGGCDSSIKITNFIDQFPNMLEGHSTAVYSISTQPNGKFLASASHETINIWDINTRKLLISYIASSNVVSVCFSPNGRFLVINLFSGEVAIIDFEQLC